MTGYVRQSIADIVNGLPVVAAPINREFNRIVSAFSATSGHTHDGSTGNAPPINLNTSVTGYLQSINGGTGGKNRYDATTDPTFNDDSLRGFAVGSVWINSVTGRIYICTNNTSSAALWVEMGMFADNRFAAPSDGQVDIGSATKRFANIFLSGIVSAATVNVTGNISAGGTVTANRVVAPVTGDVTGNLTGNVTSTGNNTFGNITVNGEADFTNTRLKNVTAPTMSSDAANKAYVDQKIAELLASAPGTLDTLNELAAAIGDDPNFAATVQSQIAGKLSLTGGTLTGDLAMSGKRVTGLAAPQTGSDAVRLDYITNLFGSTANAAASAAKAQEWAEKDEDVTVEAGAYSAKHHALKAAQSAAEAGSSASDAAASAAQGATYLAELNALYLGAYPDDPTTGPGGTALDIGTLYFNTATKQLRYWDGAVWTPGSNAHLFPNINGTVNVTDEELNRLEGITGNVESRLDKIESGTFDINVRAARFEVDSTDPALILNETDTGATSRFILANGNTYLQAGKDGGNSKGSLYLSGLNADDLSNLFVRHAGDWRSIWHSGNDGASSGLDADKVDGYHASAFLKVYETNDYIDFVNHESADYSVDGRLFYDASVGMYVRAANGKNHSNNAALWSSANFTAGSNISVSYDSENMPTLDFNVNSSIDMKNYDIWNINRIGFNSNTGGDYFDWQTAEGMRFFENGTHVATIGVNSRFYREARFDGQLRVDNVSGGSSFFNYNGHSNYITASSGGATYLRFYDGSYDSTVILYKNSVNVLKRAYFSDDIDLQGKDVDGINRLNFHGGGDDYVSWATGAGLQFYENGSWVARVGGSTRLPANTLIDGGTPFQTNLNANEVGSILFLKKTSGGTIDLHETTFGNNLRISGTDTTNGGFSLTGTWQALGRCGANAATLFRKIS